MNFDENKIMIFILIILILFLGGTFYFYFQSQNPTVGTEIESQPPVSPAALSSSDLTSVVKSILPEGKASSLSGKIKSYQGNTLVVEVPLVLGVKIPQNSDLRLRTVSISPETEIFIRKKKDASDFNEEMKRYQRQKISQAPPHPYEFIQTNTSALKPGKEILFYSSSDIKSRKVIRANKIVLIE